MNALAVHFCPHPSEGGYGGRQGQILYHEPTHLVYQNAYLDSDHIHVKNARQYYEDVSSFVLSVLQMISSNHLQSGNDYDASAFFPSQTDAQIEKARLEHMLREEKTIALKGNINAFISINTFAIDTMEYSDIAFNAIYDWNDGWFNEDFTFHDLKTNLDEEVGTIKVLIDVPHLFKGNHEKKSLEWATKVLKVPYCFYLCSRTDETYSVVMPIPPDRVSDNVKKAIADACNQAMLDYNSSHINIIEHTNCTPVFRNYPPNFFLDNEIGKLDLVYTLNAGANSWRMRFV